MIALENVSARQAPLALSSLSLAWGPGVHAVVGAPGDGPPLVLALVAGRARLRSGHVRVADGGPTDPAVRPRIAWVPLQPALPDGLRVDEVLRLASTIRGDAAIDPRARLAALGVESLLARRVASLTHEELRTVALAEALTSERARVLLLEEPLVAIDPRAATRIVEAIRERGRAGRCVVVATSSLRDATEVADDHVLLRAGKVTGRAGAAIEASILAPEGARLRVVSSDPQALLAAVANEEAVEAVARKESALVVRGPSVTDLAEAVARAVTVSGVDLTELRFEIPSLEDARAAASAVNGAGGTS